MGEIVKVSIGLNFGAQSGPEVECEFSTTSGEFEVICGWKKIPKIDENHITIQFCYDCKLLFQIALKTITPFLNCETLD